jgi:hypothetical protein
MWTFMLAVVAACSLCAGAQWRASRAPVSASLAYADALFSTPDVMRELGSPLTPAEIETIKYLTRTEIEHAFTGLRLRLIDGQRGFWRIRVEPSIVTRTFNGRVRTNASGTAYAFGMLGGAGFVNFSTHVINAVRFAPAQASRAVIVEGIGRGIGRAAVHELTHMIAPQAAHNGADAVSYEYFNAARAAQYYGDLRWTTAWPLLHARLAE